jgi:hypothetical protein
MAIDPNNPFADLPDTQNDPFADLPDAQQSESGIMPALGAGIDKMQELGYRAVKGFTDVGVPQEEQTNALGRAIGQGGALSRWADEGIARNIEEQKAYTPSVASYKDIDSIGDAASYVGEMTAQSVPMMATALSPAGLLTMGGGLSNEAYEAQPEDNKQPWRATASGFAQAGLERLGVETAIGRVFGGEGKQFVKRVGQSMLGEGATETGQEALAQWGSGKSLDEFEGLDEAFVGGALVGGTIRTGTEAGKAAYDKYRGERPELSDIEETDLTQSAAKTESVIPDPFADIGPAQDQAVTGNEVEIIPGETAGDSQTNWQYGKNDDTAYPNRGQITPYTFTGEYEQYRETPNSVPVGAALEAPIIDGEFERPRGLPNRADTIIGEDGRPMQQAQEFADSVGQASNRALPFDDVIYAEDKRDIQVKRNGEPFGGRRAAELTKEFRQAKEQGLNPQVIKVNGGYGWVSEGDNVGLDTGSVEQSSDLQVGSAGIALPRDVRGDNGGRLRESADGTTGTGDAENIALAARRDTNDDALNAEAEEIPTSEGAAELGAGSQVNAIDAAANEATTSPTSQPVEPNKNTSKRTLDEMENDLEQERKDFVEGTPARIRTKEQNLIHDVSVASVIDAGNERTNKMFDDAIELGREDIAEVLVGRSERYADGMSTTPGVSKSNPKYAQIKLDLEKRKKKAQDAAKKLREKLNSQKKSNSGSKENQNPIDAAANETATSPTNNLPEPTEAQSNNDLTIEQVMDLGPAIAGAGGNAGAGFGVGSLVAKQARDVADKIQTDMRDGLTYKEALEKARKSDDFGTEQFEKAARQAYPNKVTEIDAAANEAATSPTNDRPEPTEAQKEAGNYKKGKVRLHGLDISIENPKGSTRKGKDQDGKEWSSEMKHHYGDIKGTTGADGDSIDVFIGDNPESQKVFVVDQVDPKTGNFDEVKVMMGFDDAETAKSGYLSNYDKDWKGLGEITEASVEDFKAWTKRPRKSKQPFALPAKPKSEEVAVKDQEDWGEKIATARKNISVRWNENSTDDEISSKPLSKTWPEKEFDDVGDTYASAFAFAARSEIPRKPSQSYKKQRWVEKVKNYRQLVKDNVVDGLLTGKITKEKMKELGGKRNLQDFFAKVDLLSELDRKDWGKVERVMSYPDSMDFNPKTDKLDIPNPKTYVRINGRNREFNSTDPKVLAEQIKPFLDEKVEKPKMKFEVRGRKGSYFINKKGDPEYTRLATFDSSKEAFDFIRNNNSKLVESWESHKARVNVTKADIRNKVNKPRTGEDYRNGKNATAEDFQNTFGIKRGTFGKWVKQGKERQDMLNGTYDALMDLANITGVPPRALSLEGKLGFAFGANGRGKAMAHYEPGEVVINLTKTKGAGSLAHEWFHALDNYFQKKRDTSPTTEKGNFITHNPETYYIGPRGYSVPESRFKDMRGINKNEWRRVEGVRPEVAVSFKNLVDTLNGLDFAKRSSRLDKGKAGGYWSSNLEMAARAFESYVKAKMNANGYDNDFLANVTSATDFVRDDSRYPYIKADEIAEVEAAFDDLFNTIESKENDSGDVALFRQGDGLKKTKVKVDGRLFETGKPVTFPYLHNKDSATKMFGVPDKDSPFGRGYEPSAKYVTYHDGDKPSYGNFEAGEITFNNPLVIDNDNLNWKQALSESYGGKTGKALSKAIIKDGFDGIVTVDGKTISEIVDLTTFDESKALFSAAGTVTGNANTRTVSRSNANEIVSRFVKGLTSAGKNYVSVVSSYDDLPTEIKDAAKAQGVEYQVKGVFHKGKVHVVLDQHTSALDMETTLFHEAYGHLGIKNLFGDDITKKLNSLFIANGGLQGLRETAKRHGINLEKYIKGLDKTNMPQEMKNRVLMDELLAHLQQSNKPSVKRLAREIVGMVRDKLRKLGLPGLSKVTDSDLFYTLKKARDAANNGPSQSPTETLFRTTDDAATFSAPVEKKWSKDWFKRKLQDKFAPIKDMQASIEKAIGRELPEDQNAYRAEELFYGKTENDLNKMEKNHVKPLVDAMTNNNIDSAELDQFLIAKHARERNAHIASINPEMQDGGSGMTNAEADAILSRYEQEGKLRGLEAAASEVYKITQKRRELMRDAGLEDESLLDVWDATYEFYVPLKGYAEDSEGNSVAKTGSGFDIRGKESMRAMGRRTIAESPTAHAIQDLSATIIRSRKNEVGRTFLKMVEENPNPDIWEVFTEDNPDTERRIVNGEVKENQPIDMRSRKDDYFSVKVDGQSKYIKLKDKDGLLMKAMKNMGPEQMNTFTRSMSEVTRWLSMVNTSLNPEFTVTNFTRDIQTALFNALAEQDLTDGKVKDKAIAMKMIKGSGKAVKSLWQHSAGKLDEADPMYKWIEEFLSDGAKTGYFDSKEVDKIGTDLADLLDMANGTNKGKLLKAKHKIGDFIENVNGGIENGVRLSSYIEARKAGVTREKAASFAKNLTVNFNRKGEIGTFLNSLYMFFNAAVQGNANFARAIITPKVDEVTGKKSLNMAQKVAVGISLASFGWAALMREMAGDDEDDVPYWDKIPKGVRERNFIIPKTLWGGEPGEYLKIPLPYGYNIFYNLGDAAEAAINSDTRKSGDLAAEMALSVYASFVPLGSPVGDNGAESAFLAGTPTIGKPLIELALNKNFFGGPIYRENNPYGAQLRDSQMSMRSTGEAYKWMAGFMNDVIGDGRSYKVNDENPWYDVSPDSIEHLVEFSLGGLYRFGSRIYDNVAKSAQGGELESTDIPFARQLNGKVQPYADITQFYEARQQLKNIDAEMDSLRGKERLEFRKEYGDKLRLQSLMSSLDKRMKQLRKQRDRVEINESLSYEEKEKRLQKIEDQMKTTAARFNKQWNKVN